MSRVDRAVRRAHRHLEEAEALLASAAGLEADGRRRRAVVVSDRRVVVTWTRGGPPDSIPLPGCLATFDPNGSLLTLGDDDVQVTLRDVDPTDARQVVDLVTHWRARPLAERIGAPFHVRILGT